MNEKAEKHRRENKKSTNSMRKSSERWGEMDSITERQSCRDSIIFASVSV